MKSILIFSLTIIFSILFSIQNAQSQHSQCWACYTGFDASGQPTCNTELVDRDASSGCGCAGGCSCSGQCTIVQEAYIPGIDLNHLEVPSEGYVINFGLVDAKDILSEFVRGGIIGDQKTELAWFGSNVALYELSNNEYLIFPLRQDEFDLKSCNGEIMATIKMI